MKKATALVPSKFRQVIPVSSTPRQTSVKIKNWLNQSCAIGLSYVIAQLISNLSLLQLLHVLRIAHHNLFASLGIAPIYLQIVGFFVKYFVDFYQIERALICQSAKHAAVQSIFFYKSIGFSHISQSSIQLKFKTRKLSFQSVDSLIYQRRNRSILSRSQSLQLSYSRMNNKLIYQTFSPLRHLSYKVPKEFVTVEIVDSQTTLYCAFYLDTIGHGLHTVSYKFRLLHKTGSERTFLHTWTGTADIEIDLIIAIFLSYQRSLSQFMRIRSSQLKYDRMLYMIEGEKMSVIVDDCIMMYHFCVEGCPFSNETHEVTKVHIGDVYHGRYSEDCVHVV